MRSRVSIQRLMEVLAYDANTGELRWKQSKGTKCAGSLAGTKVAGYLRIQIGGRIYPAHQLAWAIHFGEWADSPIDHRNRDGSDNRLVNLRKVTPSENQHNRGISRNNRSGFLGVFYDGHAKRFKAEIAAGGVTYRLGAFHTAEAANEAYVTAKQRLHPSSPLNKDERHAA